MPLTKKNHYSFNFAIRPGGQTQFQVSYRVPYTGSTKLTPTTVMPADNVIVMMPKAMKFDGGSTPWAPVQDEVDAQTFVARNLGPNDVAEFTVSGTGQLPKATDGTEGSAPAAGGAAQGPMQAQPTGQTAEKPGGGLGNPIDTPDPLSKYKWWIIAGVGLALAAGAGFLLSRPQNEQTATPPDATNAPTTATVIPSHANVAPSNLLSVLRDELFQLESDKLTGKITEEQYARVKPALEIVLQNALERQKNA
jgi:hypothetical protein